MYGKISIITIHNLGISNGQSKILTTVMKLRTRLFVVVVVAFL